MRPAAVRAQQAPIVGRRRRSIASVISVLSVIVTLWILFGGGLDIFTDNYSQHIDDKVARDAVTEYQMAVSSRDRTDICVHAGLVAAAYQQAHDEENYLHWKSQEKSDCAYMNIR
jgi:hypothetical protein